MVVSWRDMMVSRHEMIVSCHDTILFYPYILCSSPQNRFAFLPRHFLAEPQKKHSRNKPYALIIVQNTKHI